jgi:hypothetical protein
MNKKKYCEVCDSEYITSRANAKYCSAACKQFAYRSRLISPEIINTIINNEVQLPVNELQLQQERIKTEQENILRKSFEESNLRINEMFKKLDEDRIQRKVETANRDLKDWLKKLLDFENYDEISLYQAKSFYEKIINYKASSLYNFPPDYKYIPFINNLLIPQIESWYKQIKYARERYVSQEMPAELKSKIMDVLSEIP